MLKIAFFLEGQTELIFVRRIIELACDFSNTSFQCFELNKNRELPASYSHSPPDPAKHFQLLNVGNDESVISAVRERVERLSAKGYSKFFLIRDMYSQAYRKRSKVIDSNLNLRFMEEAKKSLCNISCNASISIYFAIMEIEAWFIGMSSVLRRLNSTFNPKIIDPESDCFHPAKILQPLFEGKGYDKSKNQIEKICSEITYEDLIHLRDSNKCKSFREFYNDFEQYTAI